MGELAIAYEDCDAVPLLREDTTPASEKQPYNPSDDRTPEENLTFATLPLALAGKNLATVVTSDRDPATNLADLEDDVGFLPRRTTSWATTSS
jgi:hypothetical protein